jgi:hypothetical protein
LSSGLSAQFEMIAGLQQKPAAANKKKKIPAIK